MTSTRDRSFLLLAIVWAWQCLDSAANYDHTTHLVDFIADAVIYSQCVLVISEAILQPVKKWYYA